MVGKPGRPKGSVKLTPERTDIIVEALENGHSLTSAARMAGLHRDTLQRWMKRGRKGESPLLCHLYVTVQEALAKSEQKLVELVFNHAEKDWRAAAWLLARRFPHWRDKPIVSQDTRDTLDELKVKRSELELDALRYQLETLKAKEDSLDLLEVLGEG
jgi:transposase-like protein